MSKRVLPLLFFALTFQCTRPVSPRETPPALPAAAPNLKPAPAAPQPLKFFLEAAVAGFKSQKVHTALSPFLIKPTAALAARLRGMFDPGLSTEARRLAGKALERGLATPASTGDRQLPMLWCDFNGDGTPELLALPDTFFGPSPGYYLYVLRDGAYRFILDGGGGFGRIKVSATTVSLLFTISTIDGRESTVHQVFAASRTRGHVDTSWKFYWPHPMTPATPGVLLAFTTRRPRDLRTGPTTTGSLPSGGEDDPAEVSRTIETNVVARFGKGARGFRVETRPGWTFVCLSSASGLVRSSLYHGMDGSEYSEKAGAVYSRGRPWLCGWTPWP